MNLLDQAIGITLLHSLWEGAVIALALAVVLGVVRSSRVRYAAGCVAMLAILVGFGVTFYRLMPLRSSNSAVVRIPPTAKSEMHSGRRNEAFPARFAQSQAGLVKLPRRAPRGHSIEERRN